MLGCKASILSTVYNCHQSCNILANKPGKSDLILHLYIKCNSISLCQHSCYLMEYKKVSRPSMCHYLYNKHNFTNTKSKSHFERKNQLNSLSTYYECHKSCNFLGKSCYTENFSSLMQILLNKTSNEFYLRKSNNVKHMYHQNILHLVHISQNSIWSMLIHPNYMIGKMEQYGYIKHILTLICRLSAESCQRLCLSIHHKNFSLKNSSIEGHKGDRKKIVSIGLANIKYKQSCLSYKQYNYQKLKAEQQTVEGN